MVMGGWKTWTGSLGSIFSGLAVVVKCFSTGNYDDITQGVGLIFLGITGIGIGSKVEKFIKPFLDKK